ncbi:MAG: glycosyltransferase [Bacteroidales bacterium]|nr:glycosyltransferase [Bacteroidales bacterium]
MFNPLVSIVIPVHNGSNYLRESIQSAINQTYKNIEIIVVNDGSNDNGDTAQVARSFGNTIKYYEKPNGGISSAFNFGIHQMKGDYFSWLSHDDIYCDNKIESQIQHLSSLDNKEVILFSDHEIIDEHSSVISSSTIRIKGTQPFFEIYNSQLLIALKRPFINGNTVLIPKTAFDNVGLFDERLKVTQDFEMWFRLVSKYPLYYINKSLIKYRTHSNQGSKPNPSFIIESLSTKIDLLSRITDAELLIYTKSPIIENSYFQLLIYCFYKGGDNNQYPLTHYYNRLKLSTTKIIKSKYLLLAFFMKIFVSVNYRLRKPITIILYKIIKSPLLDFI